MLNRSTYLCQAFQSAVVSLLLCVAACQSAGPLAGQVDRPAGTAGLETGQAGEAAGGTQSADSATGPSSGSDLVEGSPPDDLGDQDDPGDGTSNATNSEPGPAPETDPGSKTDAAGGLYTAGA
jgi:hypothetical protein